MAILYNLKNLENSKYSARKIIFGEALDFFGIICYTLIGKTKEDKVVSSKIYWIAEKQGQISRVAKYASSLFKLEKNGFRLKQGILPKKYIYITVDKN